MVEWCNFVAQHKYPGTAQAAVRIDDHVLPAYTDINALLQLSLDLETQHSEHISLDATPPRFLTVGYLGIVDRPVPWNLSAFATVDADYESAKDAYSGLARLNIDDDASKKTHEYT